ncbi:hypothetical protein GCM10023322_83120 [Rugosimonospora acidiphila]|uniref:Transmembrane protein n=1 Tax=Rugosimonospora acidiphila TaxID=556531 RepID=A0ABP9SWJ6_9ACTN
MTPDDARAALDDIQRRHEQSRAAEARHGFSPFYLGVLALIVLVSYASYDLPNPWNGAMLFPVVALVALLVIAYVRRAPVLRKPGSGELLVGVAAGILLAAVIKGLATAIGTAGMPTPHLIAAAAGAVVCLLAARPICRGADALARLAGRRS